MGRWLLNITSAKFIFSASRRLIAEWAAASHCSPVELLFLGADARRVPLPLIKPLKQGLHPAKNSCGLECVRGEKTLICVQGRGQGRGGSGGTLSARVRRPTLSTVG